MDLSLSEEQQLLKQGVEDFVAREAPREAVIELSESELGYSPEHYARVAELGWLGVAIPERYGGAGLGLTDAAVLFEAFGYAALPGPFISSGVVSALIVEQAGSDDQRAELLPRIVSGQAIAVLALTEPGYSWGPEGVHLRAAASNGDTGGKDAGCSSGCGGACRSSGAASSACSSRFRSPSPLPAFSFRTFRIT